ncbi:MAG: pirin family protein [Chromatiales bacterium]|jgi:quercetin 2,3-dioxygenase|nr:pirin family protein [Chromatiales bacterium]
MSAATPVVKSSILSTVALSTHWPTLDPFLFCAHHNDAYPAGNERFGLELGQLRGRQPGMDFSGKDGWSMYHGDGVPGFPRHPHRGFETVTLARHGFVDHADSLGAAARFGQGDVQWMTAGQGIVHSEMFPLLEREQGNPAELFQVWLNLPSGQKMAAPHFSMLWAERIPRISPAGAPGVDVVVIAGDLEGVPALAPPPDSYASRSGSDIAIWTISMEPNAEWTMPAALSGSQRVFYFYAGDDVFVDGQQISSGHAIQLDAQVDVKLQNGAASGEFLLLQGRPIGEPVAQHGPFVMNTSQEIQQAMTDFQATQFGGWPWAGDGPVHETATGRFARQPDGSVEYPG